MWRQYSFPMGGQPNPLRTHKITLQVGFPKKRGEVNRPQIPRLHKPEICKSTLSCHFMQSSSPYHRTSRPATARGPADNFYACKASKPTPLLNFQNHNAPMPPAHFPTARIALCGEMVSSITSPGSKSAPASFHANNCTPPAAHFSPPTRRRSAALGASGSSPESNLDKEV